MADTKLTWTELRRTLAKRAGVTDKQAGAFLNAFNTQLVAGLKSDKQVKVNGLGTFKLQAIAPRKSVNVTTGEEITIEGYNKIAFIPEVGVKELVESNGERLAVSGEREEIDPLKKLGAQAEEIVDILGELGQEVKEGQSDKVQSTKEPVVEEPVVEEPVVEEPKAVEISTPRDFETSKEEPVVKEPKKEPKAKKPYHFMRDTLICVVVLLMLLLVGYFVLRSQLSSWIEGMVNSEGVPNTEVRMENEEVKNLEDEDRKQDSDGRIQAEEAWTFDELLLTEEITKGSRLAWIAKKHYGNKAYWPYLYAANKDRIVNPSQITVGTPIRVPKLSAAMRDTTNAQYIQIKKEAEKAIGK